MGVKDKMHGNEVHIVNHRFVKRTRMVVPMLEAIDVCRNKGVAWKGSLIQTSLVDLEALLGHVWVVAGWSVDEAPSSPCS